MTGQAVVAFLGGFFLGGMVGLVIGALMAGAKNADLEAENWQLKVEAKRLPNEDRP